MWKDIKGYEGLYQISDEGHVRRIMADGSAKMLKDKQGLYHTVSLSKNGEKKTFAIHRLVAEYFIERPEGAMEVNHKDGNKHNNDVSNLEWVTQSENLRHARNELGKYPFGKAPRKVRCFDTDGNLIKEYESVSQASRDVGTAYSRVGITMACKGEYKTAYGYRWEYAD